jgi:transcriptional regulator with XRE-family HTH domain
MKTVRVGPGVGDCQPSCGSESATVIVMLSARDLLLLVRRTAGISQSELAGRLGRSRSTIARWELGEMQPSYDAVRESIEACGLSAMVELGDYDDSYLYDIGEQLRLTPIERLRRLGGASWTDPVERLAGLKEGAIVIGDAAGALHGWPLMLPADGVVEVCSREVVGVDGVSVIASPPGTRGYADVRRAAERLDVMGAEVLVGSPLDLLRIERARGRRVQAGALEAVLEHRRRWPDGPAERRGFTDEEARTLIKTWLTQR